MPTELLDCGRDPAEHVFLFKDRKALLDVLEGRIGGKPTAEPAEHLFALVDPIRQDFSAANSWFSLRWLTLNATPVYRKDPVLWVISTWWCLLHSEDFEDFYFRVEQIEGNRLALSIQLDWQCDFYVEPNEKRILAGTLFYDTEET